MLRGSPEVVDLISMIYPLSKVDALPIALDRGELWLVKKMFDIGGKWQEDDCIKAADFGRWDIIRYALARGAPFSVRLCTIAVKQVRIHFRDVFS